MYDVDILFIEKVIMTVFQTMTMPLCPQFPRVISRISFNSEIDYKRDIIFLTEIEHVKLSGEAQSSSSSMSESQCPNIPAGEENWSFWSFQAKWAQLCSGVNWLSSHRSDGDFCQLGRLLYYILHICEDLFWNSVCWLSLLGRNMSAIEISHA